MKGWLFDENLPVQLRFSPKLPIVPASKVGRNPSDSQIWEFARSHDLVIVSKDADFSDRIITQSPPPRWCICGSVIWAEMTFTPCWPVSGRGLKRC